MFDDTRQMIAEIGVTATFTSIGVVVRSDNGTTRTNTSTNYSVKMISRFYRSQEWVGAVRQGMKEGVLAADNLQFVPKRGDKVTLSNDTYHVEAVETFYFENKPILYRLRMAGANQNES